MALTQQELESRLWAAANSLRGPVDPADFKAYIFPLLFFKRISDTWDDEHSRAVADFGTELTPDIEADYHRFQLPEGCHWLDLRKVHENVGVELQRILDRIQQANPDALAGIFGDVQWANKEKLPEHALLNLIGAFHTLDLRPSAVGHDVLGNAYEYLLRQFADESGKKAGEFFTPRSVVRLLTRILDPQPTDSVYDPACGSGGMLIEAANEVVEAGGSLRQMRFYGQEVQLTTSAIARMNLFVHDIEDVTIRRGDTLREPRFLDERGRLQRFDVVIANPPFSLKNWGVEVWKSDPWGRAVCGLPPASTGDFAWVQHMVASMKPDTGRVGVVMPHGVLFRGGAEKAIRECLLRSDRLEAVIGLAPNLFYSTSIPATLLIFKADKSAERRGHVLFVDGSKRFRKGRNQNTMDTADVDAIVTAHRTGNPNPEDGIEVRLVPLAEIEAKGWDLGLRRYFDDKELGAEAVSLVSIADIIAGLNEALDGLRESLASAASVELHADNQSIDSLLIENVGGVWGDDAGSGEVDVLVVRSTEFSDIGSISIGKAAATRSITHRQLERRRLRPGDILLEKSGGTPTRPVGRVVRVRDIPDPAVCSNFVQLLRVDAEAAEADYVFWRLWLDHALGVPAAYQNATTNIHNLRLQDYLSRQIPVPGRDDQRRLADAVRSIAGTLDTIQAESNRLQRAAAQFKVETFAALLGEGS